LARSKVIVDLFMIKFNSFKKNLKRKSIYLQIIKITKPSKSKTFF
jgi:hypothetical protein